MHRGTEAQRQGIQAALWRAPGFQRGRSCGLPAPGHCEKGAISSGNQALEGTALCPPVPAAVNLASHGTFSQLCSDHLSFCSKWECSCCSFLSLSLFLPPSLKRSFLWELDTGPARPWWCSEKPTGGGSLSPWATTRRVVGIQGVWPTATAFASVLLPPGVGGTLWHRVHQDVHWPKAWASDKALTWLSWKEQVCRRHASGRSKRGAGLTPCGQ